SAAASSNGSRLPAPWSGTQRRFWPTSRRRRWTTIRDILSCRCSPRSQRLKAAVCWSSPTMGGRCLLLTGLFASTTVASSARNNVSIPCPTKKRSHCKDHNNAARTLVVGHARHSWRGSGTSWSCAADRRSENDKRQEWLATRPPGRGGAGLGRDQNLGGGCGPCP